MPVVAVIVGQSFGGSSFFSALADLCIQVEGSCLAVTSPRVIEVATGQIVTMEQLGGPRVHTAITGQIDLVARDEDEAIEQTKQFLSYLPSSFREPPPISAVVREPRVADLRAIVPENRRQTYDMLDVIDGLVDDGSFFELRPHFAQCLLTGLARIGGQPVGVIANQPRYQVGVMTPECCDKAVRLMALCDSFGLPLVFLHDTPGFMVGTDVEHNKLLYKAMLLMQAVKQTTVPKFAVIVRKSFGLANFAMAGIGMGSDLLLAWPGSEISFMDPDVGANVVFGKQLEGLTPAERRARLDELADGLLYDTSPYGAAGIMRVDEIIEPGETRQRLRTALERSRGRFASRKRILAAWPNCW
jgi:acetyl-CoA carboxylase carboxyltransferase component